MEELEEFDILKKIEKTYASRISNLFFFLLFSIFLSF